MTTVFHALPYNTFIEIQSNLRRKTLHRTNKDNIRALIQFRRKRQPQHLKI